MDMPLAKLNENDLKEEAFRICQKFLGSPWNEINISNFKFSKISGGLSNTIYFCALPNNVIVRNPNTPKEVILRIYGPLQEEEHVVVIEAITFMLLSERKLGPKLYGVFPKGRLEEYIPSRSLKSNDMRQMSTLIARELAKVHSLTVPTGKIPDLFQRHTEKWLEDIEYETVQKHNKHFPLADMYRQEIDWIVKEMEKTKSPVVYCHNDLQGGNILLREDSSNEKKPSIILIDFEFGGYNYRGFDIANQFCEWMFDYNTPEPPHFKLDISKYPTKEEKIRYIRAYVHQLVSEGVIDISSIDIEEKNILKEIKPFGMAAHLIWALWSEKMKPTSSLEFCHTEHGKARLKLFWKLKEKYLKDEQLPYNESNEQTIIRVK